MASLVGEIKGLWVLLKAFCALVLCRRYHVRIPSWGGEDSFRSIPTSCKAFLSHNLSKLNSIIENNPLL